MSKWHARWRREGFDGLRDRSSRPWRTPHQTPAAVEHQVCQLRRATKKGPAQLKGLLAAQGVHLPASTIHRILARHGISRRCDLDVSGADLREVVRRYQYDTAGAMVHLDVKKIGRIPPGGGSAVHDRGSAEHRAAETARHARYRASRAADVQALASLADRSTRSTRPPAATIAARRAGYVYLHTAIDDYSRLAYTEELHDEQGTTAAGFWARAAAFFAGHGITTITRVLTDNGACYRSLTFRAALNATTTRHHRTRPYRPQTNGKVERYHRTLSEEWARSQHWYSNHDRTHALQGFLDHYNHHRPHTALNGQPPITRTPTAVDNLAG